MCIVARRHHRHHRLLGCPNGRSSVQRVDNQVRNHLPRLGLMLVYHTCLRSGTSHASLTP